ncbi:MAG: ABC transporter substrate-binding protein, partial [Chloroflexota bacterium]
MLKKGIPSIALGLSLLLAACGGSASVSTSTAPSAAAPSAAAASTAAASTAPASSAPASSPAASAAASASSPAPASASSSPSAASASAAPSSGSAAASPAASTASGPIKIGYITPLTGTLANVAQNGLNGFKLYFDTINNTVGGRKIQIIPADSQIKPDVAVTKTKQLVQSDHVQMLAGILTAAVCYALADYDKKAGEVPMVITAGCSGQGLTID